MWDSGEVSSPAPGLQCGDLVVLRDKAAPSEAGWPSQRSPELDKGMAAGGSLRASSCVSFSASAEGLQAALSWSAAYLLPPALGHPASDTQWSHPRCQSMFFVAGPGSPTTAWLTRRAARCGHCRRREAGCSQVARWALGGTRREVRRSSGREGKLMGDFRHRGGKRSAGCEPMD